MSINLNRGKDDNKSVKIVLLGDSGVGKTSLIRRYDEDIFNLEIFSTDGIDFIGKTYKGNKVNLWDFSGLERFKPIRKNYIKESSAIIIVVDSSAEESKFKEIGERFEIIADNAPNSSVIIAANKSDTEGNDFEQRVDKYNTYCRDLIVGKYLDIKFSGVFPTSAKSGKGVTEMFEKAMDGAIEQYTETYIDSERVELPNEDETIETPRARRRCV